MVLQLIVYSVYIYNRIEDSKWQLRNMFSFKVLYVLLSIYYFRYLNPSESSK